MMTVKLPMATAPLSPKAETILKPLSEKYGFTPNLLRHVGSNPNALAAVLAYAGAFDDDSSGLTMAERHIVLIAVSDENDCQYCRSAHSTAGKMMGVNPDTIKKILKKEATKDKKIDALVALARNIVESRGWANPDIVTAFLSAGYKEEHILAVLHGVAYKAFTNYVNHMFDIPVDEPFATTLAEIVQS